MLRLQSAILCAENASAERYISARTLIKKRISFDIWSQPHVRANRGDVLIFTNGKNTVRSADMVGLWRLITSICGRSGSTRSYRTGISRRNVLRNLSTAFKPLTRVRDAHAPPAARPCSSSSWAGAGSGSGRAHLSLTPTTCP
jgi:hypothetical protein